MSGIGPIHSETVALHGRGGERPAGPLVGSLVQSTTFVQRQLGSTAWPTYTRVDNPTVGELEDRLGALEDAPPSVCFGTGLAAEAALFLTLFRAGDHLVLGNAIYGGTTRLVRQVLAGLGITATFVDATDASAVAGALRPETRLVFVETPANPTLVLTDIRVVAEVAHAAGVRVAVDNTFLTPALQRPLDLGADLTVYSTTKHIEGHSTALGGAITSRDEALLERLRFIRKCTGSIQSPLGAWLTTRGVKTLPLRMRAHSENAQRVAEWLVAQPIVKRVHYPGLAGFPQAELARRQHLGFHGGVVTFELLGGAEAGRTVLEGVQLCALAEHVGTVETLLTHPATMTHADVPAEQRRATGLDDGLIRLSVGLEDPRDVIADLSQAFDRAVARLQGGVSCRAG